jgi:hypothetical protein
LCGLLLGPPKKEGKIQKSLFRFELITETMYQDLKKYLVHPPSEKCFAKKYTKGVKCSLYLEGKLDIFEKFILIISIINSNLIVVLVFWPLSLSADINNL